MMQSIDFATAPDITMFSDASGGWGCGAIWDGHWLQWEWEGKWTKQQIAIKELVPIVIACAIWGGQWRNKLVLARSDNMAVVQVITSLLSKVPTIMHLLRALFFYMALFNIKIRAEHIPGIQNIVADSISRNQMQVFRGAAPHADNLPTPIPSALKVLLTLDCHAWLLPAWKGLLRASSATV